MDMQGSAWRAFYRPRVSVSLAPGESHDVQFTVWHGVEDAMPDSLPPVRCVVEVSSQPYAILGPSFEHTQSYATSQAVFQD